MLQFNFLLWAFLFSFFLRSFTQWLLTLLNISYLRQHGNAVPEIFQDTVDQEKLKKISAYSIDSARFGIPASLAQQAFFLIILLCGFLPWLVEILSRWGGGVIFSGLFFFGALGLLTHLFQIPFDLYETFVIEQRYGFNTETLKLWLVDLLKGLILSALLGGVLLSLLLSLVIKGGEYWWVWAWVLVGLLELLILWLYPVLTAPWFNKFEPIQDAELERGIHALMEKVGLRPKGVWRMDASKRSKHTNAYFTGFGKNKRIVLFDTLLTSHTAEEILAVLAHEIGHWKKKHILKQLLLAEMLSFAAFFILAQLIAWPLLYQTFGLAEPIPYVGLLLMAALFGPLSYFAQPLGSALSRRFEREADDFALSLIQKGEPIVNAFKRLAVDNLANLFPHPLYAWFYYSHPPLVERISRMKMASANLPAQ
jgi:STE24 endopeptidase